MTETRELNNTQSYIHPQFKDRDKIPTYEEFSSRVSTEVDPTIKSEEKSSQEFFSNTGISQG